jgi:hypothetical protein
MQDATEHTPLTSGAPVTRDDAATGKLLQSILDIVAECDLAPEFAGFQIQEARNGAGLLLSVRLVPCDNVGGIVSPRTV